METNFSRERVDEIENSAYMTGVAVGQRMERERIVDLIEQRTYDPKFGHALSWIADARSVEKAELLALVKGEEF